MPTDPRPGAWREGGGKGRDLPAARGRRSPAPRGGRRGSMATGCVTGGGGRGSGAAPGPLLVPGKQGGTRAPERHREGGSWAPEVRWRDARGQARGLQAAGPVGGCGEGEKQALAGGRHGASRAARPGPLARAGPAAGDQPRPLPGQPPLAMPSPRSSRERRTGSGSSRLEFLSLVSQRSPGAPDSPSRRKEPGSSAAAPLPEEDCMKLNPSFLGIALSSLLAIDLWASKRLGVCAGEGSAWGSARPLMKVIEISGHGVPWLLGTFYGLCQSDSSAAREVLLNLLFGEAGGSPKGSTGRGWPEPRGEDGT